MVISYVKQALFCFGVSDLPPLIQLQQGILGVSLSTHSDDLLLALGMVISDGNQAFPCLTVSGFLLLIQF